ncbi:hypothetical protein RHSIM_Rhsim10G0182500 [Rhododendron simsii]|uniref:DYW domain-containing protein n=1 Tax=Rhododendron simsii TaxID=118357 RepID=A0A834GFT1_RHOSS|nr:hypothetical protein RHSIM_Rhsim10G0182500 [Rhododendron simsii]
MLKLLRVRKDLISLCAMRFLEGQLFEPFDAFRRRQGEGVGFDGLTLTAVSPVCARINALSGGREIHAQNEMVKSVIRPNVFAVNLLMDMYVKCGVVDYARRIIDGMGRRDLRSWNDVLYTYAIARRRAGRLKEALETISKVLFEIEPKYVENYVVLLNIYENAGLWEGVKMVREMMEKHGIKKEVGCSWIEIKSRFHIFVAGGDPELGSSEEYQKLWTEFKEANNGVVLHDVYEEIKKAWICEQSERLGAMFGLIHSRSGISLRITKNLCVCADCHSWMKTVSQVLREMKHFRHFEKGSCSCKDYW